MPRAALLARLLDARPPRRPCVSIHHPARVLALVCDHAREGLHEPYKREVIGILLGRVSRDGRTVRCVRAVPYRTWLRWRTAIDPHPDALLRRSRALARESGLRYLGCYHSHPEEAGKRSWGLSEEDRDFLRDDPDARIEVVVSVADAGRRAASRAEVPASRARPVRNRDGSLTLYADGHHFRLGAEVKADVKRDVTPRTPPPSREPRRAPRGPSPR